MIRSRFAIIASAALLCAATVAAPCVAQTAVPIDPGGAAKVFGSFVETCLSVLLLFLIVASFVLTVRDFRAQRQRDVIYVEGFDRPDQSDAEASARQIRDAYRRAGKPLPIILNVPPGIFIKRDPR